jgi:hypothetical protein
VLELLWQGPCLPEPEGHQDKEEQDAESGDKPEGREEVGGTLQQEKKEEGEALQESHTNW